MSGASRIKRQAGDEPVGLRAMRMGTDQIQGGKRERGLHGHGGNLILERVNGGCRSHTSPAQGLPTGAARASDLCGIKVRHQSALPWAFPPLWDQSGSSVSHSMGLATDAPGACPTRAAWDSALSYDLKWVTNQQGATRWASPTLLLCFCPMFPLRACSLAGGPFLSLPVARRGFSIGMLHSRHHLHPSVGFPGGEPCSRCRS